MLWVFQKKRWWYIERIGFGLAAALKHLRERPSGKNAAHVVIEVPDEVLSESQLPEPEYREPLFRVAEDDDVKRKQVPPLF